MVSMPKPNRSAVSETACPPPDPTGLAADPAARATTCPPAPPGGGGRTPPDGACAGVVGPGGGRIERLGPAPPSRRGRRLSEAGPCSSSAPLAPAPPAAGRMFTVQPGIGHGPGPGVFGASRVVAGRPGPAAPWPTRRPADVIAPCPAHHPVIGGPRREAMRRASRSKPPEARPRRDAPGGVPRRTRAAGHRPDTGARGHAAATRRSDGSRAGCPTGPAPFERHGRAARRGGRGAQPVAAASRAPSVAAPWVAGAVAPAAPEAAGLGRTPSRWAMV